MMVKETTLFPRLSLFILVYPFSLFVKIIYKKICFDDNIEDVSIGFKSRPPAVRNPEYAHGSEGSESTHLFCGSDCW